MSVLPEYRYLSQCRPILTNHELLNFAGLPFMWQHLVTPLKPRCVPRHLHGHFESISENPFSEPIQDEMDRPKVLVCHDLAGNYRGDRYLNGCTKWDDYRFYHWSGIDYFCYFSHSYITVPTLSWINAAHKHGVSVLGTVIVESARGRTLLEDILKSETYMQSIADALTGVAKSCKFEGWLLNVECSLAEDKIQMLRDFAEYLTQKMRKEISNSVVIWYDSILSTGQLVWQNELNDKNKLFFDACDGILLNYGWSEEHLKRSAEAINNDRHKMNKIFVGIDVFGRGQVAKFETDITLAKIDKFNFSVGIFAPGWTFEATREFGVNISSPNGNDNCNQHFMERNDIFWKKLWKYFYSSGPSKLPFHSTFCIGSGKQTYQDGLLNTKVNTWWNLSNQALQPSVPSSYFERYFPESFSGGCCLKILPTVDDIPKRLFVTDFRCDQDLIIAYAVKAFITDVSFDLYINVTDSHKKSVCQIICADEANISTDSKGKIYFRPLKEKDDLQVIQIFISERREAFLPTFGSLNGWQIRYYYVSFDRACADSFVTDIGFLSPSGCLLGALHVHDAQGSTNLNLEKVKKINSEDFIN